MENKKSVLGTRWEDRNNRTCIRLSVSGSRTLEDERVKILIMDEIDKTGASRIITHAEPGGVCLVARKLAKDMGIPLVLHHLNFKYRRGVFYQRTLEVFYDTDYAIFIHDGVSIGTKNEHEVAQKMGIPFSYHLLKPSEFKTSVAFDIDIDWKVLTNNLIDNMSKKKEENGKG